MMKIMKIIKPGGVFQSHYQLIQDLIWRLARFINSFFKAKNVLGLTRLEYNY